eukprot:TRINITY_DN7565_c0_g1_i2.p1 TRINITY_DN7565_c0_g1~~TRINITY_DN7565_c0_g1_i2.p1  ORF type:complete len:258 (-),score=70.38 TRINITY_DN7565_c0_g1_i2:64-837(-)
MSLIDTAKKSLALMDLTTLNDNDTDEKVIALCKQAKSKYGCTAAVCVYPRFVPISRKTLREIGAPQVKIATVTNFPHGNDDIEIAVAETKASVSYGADEVDVVFPYRAFLKGETKLAFDLVKQCKEACADKALLKVILETGEIKDPVLIKKASEIAIDAGADFIKTSTGKVAVNATIEAATVMITAIKEKGKKVGFKAAGGVRDAQQAGEYLAVASKVMGPEWATASTFRFGASSLLKSLIDTIEGSATQHADQKAY